MAAITEHLSLLSEPVRIRLLTLLSGEELGVGELTKILQLPQSTVSRHLKALQVRGWVLRRSEGTAGLYRAAEPPDEAASDLWRVVAEDHRSSLLAGEDRARLSAILTARTTDSKTFFGRMHAQWDALRSELFGRDFWLPTLLAAVAPDIVVADLGCGTGEAVSHLAPVVGRVIGVDREPAMLKVARMRTDALCNVDLREGELDALPLGDGEVNVVLLMLVLHHVASLSPVFAEVARALKPGGRCVVLDMVAHDRADWRHTMGHVHMGFAEERLGELASDAGLSVLSYRPLSPDAEASGPPLFVAVFGRA